MAVACDGVEAEWVPDILSRALGNRGNARSRMVSDKENDHAELGLQHMWPAMEAAMSACMGK